MSEISSIIPTEIYVDVSNIYKPLQRFTRSFSDIKPINYFFDKIISGCIVEKRVAVGSITTTDSERWISDFKDYGFKVRSLGRLVEHQEDMVDDCICAHIYRSIVEKITFGKITRIIVVSGDGNQKNCSNIGIFDSIQLALLNGIQVILWGCRGMTHQNYINLTSRFPQIFELKYFDDIAPQPKQLSFAATATTAEIIPSISRTTDMPKKGKKTFRYQIVVKDLDMKAFPVADEMTNRNLFNATFGINAKWASKSPLQKADTIFLYFDNEESFKQALERKNLFNSKPIHSDEIRRIRAWGKIDEDVQEKNEHHSTKILSELELYKFCAH